MGSDYNYQEVASIDEETGYPLDKYGRFLDKNDHDHIGNHLELTNPYGALYFAVGNEDDFVCFDYAVLDKCKDGKTRIVIEACANSETGCFIEGFGYEICELGEAANVALGMIDNAVEWCFNDPECQINLDKEGWNQDEYYFYRCVCLTEKKLMGKDIPNFTFAQKRFGGKEIDEFLRE